MIVGNIESCSTSNGCGDEVVDQEVDDEREDQRLDDLEQTSEASTRAALLGARAIVGGRVGGIGHRRSRLGAGRRRVA